MRLATWCALLAGCSEYQIDPQDKAGEMGYTPTSDVTAACGGLSAPAVAVGLNTACDVPPAVGGFTPIVEWELTGYNAYGPAVVGQLDDDDGSGTIDANDTPDIVFVPIDGTGIVAVNGKTGKVEWQSPAATSGIDGAAIGDVDADGIPEIVATNGASNIVLMDNRGNKIWQKSIDTAGLLDFMYPAIADMDGDGFAEIIAGRTILSWDGRILGVGTKGVGAVPNQGYPSYVEGSVAVPVDLDGDGELEVVVGNAAYRMDGSLKYKNDLPDGCPAVADFDGDGEPEVVMVTGNTVYTLESDMTPTGWSTTFANTNYVGPPAADDLDGDGLPDFVVVGSGHMKAFSWDGTLLWNVVVQDTSGAAGPILYDFELDGYPEVVYADEQFVRVFNGLDGSIKLESSDHASATGFETPIVADVDDDGEVEIVMLHGASNVGITVFGDQDHSWPAGRQVWNQHAYSITNVDDDLGIPVTQAPNWGQYNNFRSGDAGLPPSAWNDAVVEVVDVCTDECPDRTYYLVRVQNAGTEPIPAGLSVVVRAGVGGPAVASATVPAEIPSGMTSEGIQLTVATADLAGADPVVEVDRDAGGFEQLLECDEGDNLATGVPGCG